MDAVVGRMFGETFASVGFYDHDSSRGYEFRVGPADVLYRLVRQLLYVLNSVNLALTHHFVEEQRPIPQVIE